MSQEVFIDPLDMYQLQQMPGMREDLKMDHAADANAARKEVLPPSELVMGPNKPYKVSAAFVSSDPRKRWKYHTHSKETGAPLTQPFSGAMVQYTVQDSPGGQFDGWTVSEYIMTNVGDKRRVCSAMGVLQALGVWNNQIVTGGQMIQIIEQSFARIPVLGVHVDWSGQSVTDGDEIDQKTGLARKVYKNAEHLKSWRDFFNAAPPPQGQRIPNSRIEPKNSDGSPIRDERGRPLVYVARAEVTRRENLNLATQSTTQTFGSFQAQGATTQAYGPTGGFNQPMQFAGTPPTMMQQPVQQPMQQAPVMQQPVQQVQQQQQPVQQYAPQPQPMYAQPQGYVQTPQPPIGAPAPQAAPAIQPQFQQPQPVQPWQQQAPTWVNQ